MMALSFAHFSVVENNGQVSLGLRNQTESLHTLHRSKWVKKSPTVKKVQLCFSKDLGEGCSAWDNSSLHLQAPAPQPQSWNKAVLAERGNVNNVFFPFFLWWCDFEKEWVRSLAVNLKSYSHHHWPNKAVILFFWGLAVVKNKPWSKRGHLCSHTTPQKSWKHWHQGPHNPITLPGKSAVWPAFWKKFR